VPTLKHFLSTLIIFLGIDFIWLGLISKNFYNKELSSFNRATNWAAIVLVYLVIAMGITFFVLPKAQGEPLKALLWGALFGMIAYGVYDLTNLAVLADWTIKMTAVDIIWGAVVCGLTSALVTHFIK